MVNESSTATGGWLSDGPALSRTRIGSRKGVIKTLWNLRAENENMGAFLSIGSIRKRKRIVTREEELRLLTACENRYRKHLRPIVICALDTGMRRGGLCPKKSVPLSPQSGRLKIAQRFIAGIGRNRDEVCEADG